MKQATLLKAWHPKGSAASGVPKPKDKPPDDMVELSDEDDEFLVQAMDETLAGNSTSAFRDGSCSMQKPLEQLEGFDVVAGQTWVYPTNYPVRSYQFNIVQSALFKNTMVILPTGLGKTFIAAVVMYNFYRWYPTGKIVFMAPTRPLVAQQIEACYNIMGIPLEDTMEMTGTVPAGQRAEGWRQRRVFFLTPQVMMNDLLRNALRPHDVRCLVIDEAHKALGSYSYCQVVKEIIKDNNQFRILALSATPGTDVKAVRNVLANLMISHVELRTEDSLDIQAFTQKRTIEKVVVPLGEEIGELKNKFLGVIRMYLDRLDRAGAIPRVNPESLGKYRMLLLKEGFQQNPPSCLSSREVGQLQGYFSLLISLYHAYELLLAHGMQPFFFFLKGIVDGEKSQPRVRYELMHNGDFEDLYKHLEQRLGVSEASANDTLHPTAAAAASSLYENTLSDAASRAAHIVGHPKLAKLEEIILEHFRNFAGNEGGTRVMVFSQYRDSVKEITAQLNRHQPLVKAMNFVGQRAGTAKGFSQKEQLLVVKKFREGGYNVLVSTCVGEEGLDIGEIDLIVCFDAPKSPIRLVQRMGRTGRKREGRIVVLLTEGKEEQAYKESNYKKQNIHRAITSGRQLGNLYEASPRMVPRGINPVCHRMHMTVPEYRSAKNAATSGRGARSILNFITGKQQKKSSAALNKQEELYYEAHYEVAPSTVPLLPPAPARFLSLQKFQAKHKKTETVNDCNRPRLSLSSWTPWQCEEQRTQYVAHSSKTKLYVEVMRFIENTRLADEELDAYSLELKPFLQMEYVLSSDECLSPDPNLVGAGSKDSSTGKKGPRKKLTKKADRWVVADDVKSKEETDEKDCKGPNNVALSVVKQERPEDADKVVKKKKKRRVITDFFQDKSQSHDSSSCISFETDLCERVEEMDCQKDVEADEECVVLVSSGTHDVDMEDRGNADAADSREEELEPDPVEVEIQTPPRLDVDVFPSPGHTLPPVDVAKVVFGHGQATDDKTANKLVIDVTHDSMDSRGCGVGTPDMECQKSGTRTRSCKMKFSKLEVDSDIEDFLDDECFKDEKGRSGDDHSIHEQPSSTTEKALLEVDKVHSKVAEKQTEAPSQAAVEAWDLIGDVNMDSFCNELFNSDADMLGDNVCSKVDDKKKPVPKSPVISTRGPTLLSELGIHSEDLFDTKWDQTADNTDALKPGDKGAKASSPIIIASQRLAPPSHSTPSRTVPTGSFVNAAVSPRDLDNGPGGICVPSPIRRAVPECMENSDWNLHSDSDMELFENASDGRISDQSINSGGEEGCDDMGITELCNFIEENSVVEEARDNPVSRRSLLAQKLSGSPTENVETIKLIVSCNGSQETASSSVNLNDRSTIGNKQSSGGKSLSIKQLSNSCRRDLKAEKSFKESSSRSMEVESKSIAKVAKDPPSLHMSSVRDQSTAAKSLSAIQQDPDQNQSSASKRPSFEITVDWSDFDSGSGSDEPVATAKPSTQLQKGRASLSSTFGAGGMTQSRNVPVAMVKPIMCSTATKTVDVISSGDDSPVQVRRRPCQKRILSQSSTESESSPIAMRRPSARCLDDSDEDFQALTCRKQPQTQKRRLQKVINKKVPKNGAATRKKPQQSSRKKSNFIEHEADVSADIVNSSDESENSSLDHLDESFIDDQTQVPNKTLYLQTVRSPVNPAKFKIGHSNHVRYSEVFSQAVSQDEADYERDSFCVGSDDSSALHRLSSSASDQLEEQESPVRSRVKTRQRKRRIRISSTSEEESCRTKYISKSQKIDVDDSPVSRKHQGEELAKPASKVFRCVGAAIEVSGCALASLPGNITSALTPGSETSRVLSREERLRLQKIRQEEFRRTHMASLHNKRSLSADVCQSPIEAQAQIDETITIIVDTREIASGTALVSALRAFKGIQVEVFSLAAGSLVVGRRCCILRKALADFGNPQNNSRLVAEVRHLFELYDRPCLILERPQRVKPGERPFKRTKYFDNMLMFLNSTHAKVFFSDSQANTAEVVVALAKKESQKGMALPSPKCLQSKNPAVQFYLAFPKVSLATAISLTTAYPSVRSLVKSSVEELQERIKISESRAKDILDFCKASAIV